MRVIYHGWCIFNATEWRGIAIKKYCIPEYRFEKQ